MSKSMITKEEALQRGFTNKEVTFLFDEVIKNPRALREFKGVGVYRVDMEVFIATVKNNAKDLGLIDLHAVYGQLIEPLYDSSSTKKKLESLPEELRALFTLRPFSSRLNHRSSEGANSDTFVDVGKKGKSYRLFRESKKSRIVQAETAYINKILGKGEVPKAKEESKQMSLGIEPTETKTSLEQTMAAVLSSLEEIKSLVSAQSLELVREKRDRIKSLTQENESLSRTVKAFMSSSGRVVISKYEHETILEILGMSKVSAEDRDFLETIGGYVTRAQSQGELAYMSKDQATVLSRITRRYIVKEQEQK